jgi:hypothetical protein
LRRIPLSRRSHIIGFQPLPTGTAEHESALERDFVTLTSFLDPGASITAQPITVSFRDGARARRYTPDFLVRSGAGRSELIEVKYRADLCANWERLKPGFVAACMRARADGAAFRVVTEQEIRGTTLDNAKRLLPLRSAPCDPEIVQRAMTVVRSLDEPTFGSVLAAFPANRSLALATLWRLIARGALRVELSAPINFDTSVSVI